MNIVETQRLNVRELTLADAPFILELLNEPGFIEYIGDKGVRDLAGAKRYLMEGPIASYAKHGHGLWLVELKAGAVPLGMCGILKRDVLDHADLGYAFLARFGGQGYAHESAAALLQYGLTVLQLPTLVAITALENPASFKLLAKLGFRRAAQLNLAGYSRPSLLFTLPGAGESA